MPPRIVLIVNPFASRVTPERLESVERILGKAGAVATQATRARGHATELAAGADADAIVVFSGDGGYNEVLNGVAGDIPVGFVPGGGTSVLPRALGLPREPDNAALKIASALAAGRTRRISLGRANGRRFGFNAGIGIDSEAVRRLDELGRADDGRRPGDVAFALTLAKTLAAHRLRFEPRFEIAGYGRAGLLFVANCDPYTYAGAAPLRLVPGARFELGLDFVAPTEVRPLEVPAVAVRAVAGRLPAAKHVLHGHDLDRIEVICDEPLPLQSDGEDLGDVEHVVFEAERDAVSVLV